MATCPGCRADIPNKNINVQEGVALCTACRRVTRLHEIAQSEEDIQTESVATATPPCGCSVEQTGWGEHISCTLRELSFVGFLFLWSVLWNGITSIAVYKAVVTTYQQFTTPAGGQDGSAAQPDTAWIGSFPFGLLGIWIVLTPFMIIGAGSFLAMLLFAFGSTKVRLEPDAGWVSTGVGPIRRLRHFDPRQVMSVRVETPEPSENSKPVPSIVLKTSQGQKVRLGRMLPTERRVWLAAYLRERMCGEKRT